MIQTIPQLKAYFQRGCKPTEQQFADLIDSLRHKEESIPQQDIIGLQETLNNKADRSNIQKTIQQELNSLQFNGVKLSDTISLPAAYDITELLLQFNMDMDVESIVREFTMATYVLFNVPDMRLLIRTAGLNMTGLPDSHSNGMLYIRCIDPFTYQLSFYVPGYTLPYVCQYADELTPWTQLATTDHTHSEYDQAASDAAMALSKAEDVERQLADKADTWHTHSEYDQAVSDAAMAMSRAEEVYNQLSILDVDAITQRLDTFETNIPQWAENAANNAVKSVSVNGANLKNGIFPASLDMTELLALLAQETTETLSVESIIQTAIAFMTSTDWDNPSVLMHDMRLAAATAGYTINGLPQGDTDGILYVRYINKNACEVSFYEIGGEHYTCWFINGTLTPWTQLATTDMLGELITALNNLNDKIAAL
ncbi:MAG: hypothetical protein NC038_05440 [Paludibacter sp.]|nr:hypothetical protein [Bacteroidales bacterium]MCM1069814.1 hypothetical protein [Prevotella sp.]MCM1353992.1 hypothetical protein [Bacteroides sp.]MCM1443366.1 hypothetical protein [Muribaculum sp.]MCM1482069.1 hypothetical protein [Paludibacter sp.]